MNQKPQVFDVIIVGGGLAGLCSAIHLSKYELKILVIEKNNYPKHKVCGEYISNEVLPYLSYLGVNVFNLGAQKITRFELSTSNNKLLKSNLPLGGFGISRYALDNALFEEVKRCKVLTLQDSVINIQYLNDEFLVDTKNKSIFKSKVVIGAYGKRSAIDVTLDRNFIKKKSPFLAVKTHVKGDFPKDLVALHNFKGGYCGVSKVENDIINLCYITDFEAFKTYKDIDEFQEKVIFKNAYLKAIFKNSMPVFDKPLTISQISFSRKNPVENHIIMCGDTAGMIHPLCGNGMSMAIRSAQIASTLIIEFIQGKKISRTAMEKAYKRSWNKEFRTRLKVGHIVAKLFSNNQLAEILLRVLIEVPKLTQKIIKQTHGKPMLIK